VDDKIRLLRNVMGLWLVQECRRRWQIDYDELRRLAEDVGGEVPLFDPDDDAFLTFTDMPAQIAAACVAAGQQAPQTPGEVVRSILVSLACKYRLVLERLIRVTGRRVDVVHVIGGGVRNALLCQLTADLLGRPLLAGPVEATALGNVLVQAQATGELGSLADLRAVAAESADPVPFDPSPHRDHADETYGRFLEVTGLAVDEPEPAIA
jgi:rhamnulokinase